MPAPASFQGCNLSPRQTGGLFQIRPRWEGAGAGAGAGGVLAQAQAWGRAGMRGLRALHGGWGPASPRRGGASRRAFGGPAGKWGAIPPPSPSRGCAAPVAATQEPATGPPASDREALGRALVFETQRGFQNVRGSRHADFSDFLCAQLRGVLEQGGFPRAGASPRAPVDLVVTAGLLRRAVEYSQMDVGSRETLLRDVSYLLLDGTPGAAQAATSVVGGRRGAERPEGIAGDASTSRQIARGAGAAATSADQMSGPFPHASYSTVFFDFETTGLDTSRVRAIDIGAVAPGTGASFNTLVNPSIGFSKAGGKGGITEVDDVITKITGITEEDVQSEGVPGIADALTQFEEFISAQFPGKAVVLVAHNAKGYDVPVLVSEYRRIGREIPKNWRFLDTIPFSKEVFAGMGRSPPVAPPEKGNYASWSLENLGKNLGVPANAEAHRALADSQHLVSAFDKLVGLAGRSRAEDLFRGGLFEASQIKSRAAVKSDNVSHRSLAGSRRGGERRQARIGAPNWPPGGQNTVRRTAPAPPLEFPTDERLARHPLAPVHLGEFKEFTSAQKKKLAEAGFLSLQDVLRHYPKKHFLYDCGTDSQLESGDRVWIVGTIKHCSARTAKSKPMLFLTLGVEARRSGGGPPHTFTITDFRAGRNLQWIAKQFENTYKVGTPVVCKGEISDEENEKWKNSGGWKGHWKLKLDDGLDSLLTSRPMPGHDQMMSPDYSDRAPLKAVDFKKIIPKTVDAYAAWVMKSSPGASAVDPIPEEIRQEWELMGCIEAVRGFHAGEASPELVNAARRRLVFEECFMVQVALLLRRDELQRRAAVTQSEDTQEPAEPCLETVALARENLGFDFTNAQHRVLGEILEDLKGPGTMLRLVQGDVGCGKTAIALLALLAACGGGPQGALMAPTDLLATQHFRTLEKMIDKMNGSVLSKGKNSAIRLPQIALLTGSTKAQERAGTLRRLESGEVGIAVGTHALIGEGVKFNDLTLAVVDEQHKFGVDQRSRLQEKGKGGRPPHILSMSATPIPRTLALTLHGDMALSIVDERPPGRAPVQTRALLPAARSQAYATILDQVSLGHKAFVVCPAVMEGSELESAEAQFAQLSQNELSGVKCGLLHGQLSHAEKTRVQDAFMDGKIQVLIATVVVEVGVDVPEATVMLIEGADRFGLAQLHQLRGRVGRSGRPSFCFLIAGSGSEAPGEAAVQRLEVLESTSDGFKIAEADLMYRGPGELVGSKQAGQLPAFALTDLRLEEDRGILEEARQAASKVLASSSAKGGKLPEPLATALAIYPPLPRLDVLPESIATDHGDQ